jgi:hypothetical protein
MTDENLVTKFRGQADGVLTAQQTDEILYLCWSVSSLDDVASIPRASVPV